MVTRPLLSDRTMHVTIPGLRARRLETRLGIDGRSIAFDRQGVVVGPVMVVIKWAARQPQGSTGGATNVIGVEGDLSGRIGEMTVKAGDLFMVEGDPAEVTINAKEVDGVMVAGFRLTTGGS